MNAGWSAIRRYPPNSDGAVTSGAPGKKLRYEYISKSTTANERVDQVRPPVITNHAVAVLLFREGAQDTANELVVKIERLCLREEFCIKRVMKVAITQDTLPRGSLELGLREFGFNPQVADPQIYLGALHMIRDEGETWQTAELKPLRRPRAQ